MSHPDITQWTRADYERAAQEYLDALPLEHFMEATNQGTQRRITLASVALVEAQRPDVQLANELLVQSPVNNHLVQVVPDNMVLLTDEPLAPMGSFNQPFEAGRILWVLEYVSPSNPRKDYVDNLHKYEQELKIPYYLLFYPEKQDLRLYRHNGAGYELVPANEHGRSPLAELELEIGLLDRWARFWFRGELLPLPAELLRQMDELRGRLEAAERRAEAASRSAEKEKQRAEKEKQRAEKEKQRAEVAEAVAREREQRLAQADAELHRLRAMLQQPPGPTPPA